LSAPRSLAAAETLEAIMPNEAGVSAGAARVSGAQDSGTQDSGAQAIAIAALRLHAERMTLSEREQRVAGAFTSAHPAVPVAEVAALPVDVHDLEGLRRLAKDLAGDPEG
jgi:hypothetical protein